MGEGLPDAGKVLWANADARIAHLEHRLFTVAGQRNLYRAAAIGELDRIVQKILDDLGEAQGIGVGVKRFSRQADGQLPVAPVGHGLKLRHRVLDRSAEVGSLSTQLDMAAGDAGDVEQVVDQARHMIDAALDRVARCDRFPLPTADHVEDMDSIAQRRQRIAQLVREGRQKLVLPPIGGRQVDRIAP